MQLIRFWINHQENYWHLMNLLMLIFRKLLDTFCSTNKHVWFLKSYLSLCAIHYLVLIILLLLQFKLIYAKEYHHDNFIISLELTNEDDGCYYGFPKTINRMLTFKFFRLLASYGSIHKYYSHSNLWSWWIIAVCVLNFLPNIAKCR